MVTVDRRTALAIGTTAVMPMAAAAEPDETAAIAADLATYDGFGEKRAAGAGDEAAGRWIAERLTRLGYAVSRQSFGVPRSKAADARIIVDGKAFVLVPQMPLGTTAPGGLTAPIAQAAQLVQASGAGKIAVLALPFGRHSALTAPTAAEIDRLRRAGVAAVILVTDGPSGEPLALNIAANADFGGLPIATAGRVAGQALVATSRSGGTGRLTISGTTEPGQATNIVGRIDRGGPTLVLSTPRSGWFHCAAERGPGIAVLLALADWVRAARPDQSLVAVATSGHEYQNAGAEYFLADAAPSAAAVRLWVHLGAGFAARDFHETAAGLLPLPSADAQRFLAVSPQHLAQARQAFKGIGGLEQPYPVTAETGGELGHIAAAGYGSIIGALGAHRFHHSRKDRLDKTDAAFVVPVLAAFRRLITAI